MPTLLARNAEVLVAMDGQRRELKNAGLYAEDGIIKQVGPTAALPSTADTIIDLTGQIALPGFVNAHHHLNQTRTRTFPAHRTTISSPGSRRSIAYGPAPIPRPRAPAR